MYPTDLTQPMEEALTSTGFRALKTAAETQQALEEASTALLVINSVCGCAAGAARPGALAAVQAGGNVPEGLFTVFAGVDKEAVDVARTFLLPYPPCSPGIAVLKKGKLAHFISRMAIEGRSPQEIAQELQGAFAAL